MSYSRSSGPILVNAEIRRGPFGVSVLKLVLDTGAGANPDQALASLLSLGFDPALSFSGFDHG